MRYAALLVLLASLSLPATASAKPAICTKKGLTEALVAGGEDPGAGFGQIRCGDVTDDGRKDAVFTVLSGGSAGATRFGVAASDAELLVVGDGYKVSVDIVSRRRFDVQQPVYRKDDANCCPSSFRFTPYRWTGDTFKAGEVKRYKKVKKRFFA